VWDRGRKGLNLSSRTFRVTPGIGLRVYTPVGPLRVDVGYNPYAQPAGPAYYSLPINTSGNAPLFCVSPGNSLIVRNIVRDKFTHEIISATPDPNQGACPASFEPQRRSGFLSRLTPTFSIQQAF
ncbi:MAG TPA: hypothetical protein VFJ74_15850, partial [Gemmatimonadaceae bacterium]|nr:hypothetical protein [Gemmatimonadaceae bacterium]